MGQDVPRYFRFRLVFDLSFALSLSKGHHERTTLVTLNNEKTLEDVRVFLTDTNARLTMRLYDNKPAGRVWRTRMADQVKVDVWYDYA